MSEYHWLEIGYTRVEPNPQMRFQKLGRHSMRLLSSSVISEGCNLPLIAKLANIYLQTVGYLQFPYITKRFEECFRPSRLDCEQASGREIVTTARLICYQYTLTLVVRRITSTYQAFSARFCPHNVRDINLSHNTS